MFLPLEASRAHARDGRLYARSAPRGRVVPLVSAALFGLDGRDLADAVGVATAAERRREERVDDLLVDLDRHEPRRDGHDVGVVVLAREPRELRDR